MNLAQDVKAGRRSAFVISLDFELLWGVRDHADKTSYGANVLGERQAIPAMLGLFEKYSARATWAAVGMLFAANRSELLASLPTVRPSYSNPRLSSFSYLDEVGEDEESDPYYFGAKLLDLISAADGQEIGSHTFSHYYCLERGQTVEQFDADISAAIEIATHRGISLRSFVFPRNQRSEPYLDVLKRKGLHVFRGNERSWIYRASAGASQPPHQRLIRLIDHYLNISGNNSQSVQVEAGLLNVASSRFLRPYSRKLSQLDFLRLHRITSAMTVAARRNEIFHLWWHPHNFGVNVAENIAVLDHILKHHQRLREEYGMASLNMSDFL